MRFVTEFVAAFAYAIYRLAGSLDAVEPDVAWMREVLEEGKDPITAEPLYVLLAMHGHPDAHEKARTLARDARIQKRPLSLLLRADASIASYLAKMSPEAPGRTATLPLPVEVERPHRRARYCGPRPAHAQPDSPDRW